MLSIYLFNLVTKISKQSLHDLIKITTTVTAGQEWNKNRLEVAEITAISSQKVILLD